MQRIVALCRESGRNCMVLSQEGVIDILLTGFSSFLSSVNPDLNGKCYFLRTNFSHLRILLLYFNKLYLFRFI